MQKRLIFLLAPVFLLFTTECSACVCNDFRSLEENIKLYAFIAHVKIVSKTINNDTVIHGDKTRASFGHEAELGIQILELFQGESLRSIREDGIKSSCEIGIREGEEWIIFGWYDPKTKLYSVGACSPSRKIKNTNGERGTDWAWDLNSGMLTGLKKHFGHPSSEPRYESGVYRNYYPNGSIEWVAEYEDNKLHGNRKVYFANGVLWKEDYFKNDTREGSQKTYTRSGQLINELDYEGGEIIHSIYWYDTSYSERRMRAFAQSMTRHKNIDSILAANPVIIQKQSEGFNEVKQGFYHSRTYNENGSLATENFTYSSGETRLNCRYKGDKLVFEGLYTKSDDHTIEKKWDEKGELISLKEWIKGKYAGDKIK